MDDFCHVFLLHFHVEVLDILGMDVLFEELPEIVNLGVQESTRMLKHCFFC